MKEKKRKEKKKGMEKIPDQRNQVEEGGGGSGRP